MRRRTSIEANTQNHSPKGVAVKTNEREEALKALTELTEEQAKMVTGGVDQLPSEQASLNFSKVKF